MVHVRLALAPRRPRPDRRARVGAARAPSTLRRGGRGRAAGARAPLLVEAPRAAAAGRGARHLLATDGGRSMLPCARDTAGAFRQLPCTESVGNGRLATVPFSILGAMGVGVCG